MTKFQGRPSDMKWGKYDFAVTKTQCETLDGLWFLLTGLPISRIGNAEGTRVFYSQTPSDGTVIIGQYHRSVNVDRNGRITGNIKED